MQYSKRLSRLHRIWRTFVIWSFLKKVDFCGLRFEGDASKSSAGMNQRLKRDLQENKCSDSIKVDVS